jgi:hypothetical protein
MAVPKDYFTSLKMCAIHCKPAVFAVGVTLRKDIFPVILKMKMEIHMLLILLHGQQTEEYAPRELNKGRCIDKIQ